MTVKIQAARVGPQVTQAATEGYQHKGGPVRECVQQLQ